MPWDQNVDTHRLIHLFQLPRLQLGGSREALLRFTVFLIIRCVALGNFLLGSWANSAAWAVEKIVCMAGSIWMDAEDVSQLRTCVNHRFNWNELSAGLTSFLLNESDLELEPV